jgi:leukotriene-A4 hydrolase
MATRDCASQSKPHEATTVDLGLALNVDFERSVLNGTATWTVERSLAGAPLLLDTKDLTIDAVRNGDGGAALPFELLPAHPIYGTALKIGLPPGTAPLKVAIDYRTSPDSSACQWLPKEQTAGKQYPYMFTQCQAIHARALLPCQDACGVKFTYQATVTVPEWATALMSALSRDAAKRGRDEPAATRTFAFEQPCNISAYLLALAVGQLQSRDAGPRSKVRPGASQGMASS